MEEGEAPLCMPLCEGCKGYVDPGGHVHRALLDTLEPARAAGTPELRAL